MKFVGGTLWTRFYVYLCLVKSKLKLQIASLLFSALTEKIIGEHDDCRGDKMVHSHQIMSPKFGTLNITTCTLQ